MMKTLKRAGGVVVGSVVLWATTVAVALGQVQNGTPVTLCDPLGKNCAYGNETFVSVAGNVTYFISVDIVMPLASIMVLVGAFQMITSAGEPEKYTQGRKTIVWAAVGLVAALLATSVVTLIKSIFGVS
jgi:hypothetical protein